MKPEVFAQAIVSIEHNYGLRLDARSTWLRLDEFKKVKELAGGKCNETKGWYGLKGACKRGRKGEGEARSKESKVDIASRIKKRKMGESSKVKKSPKIEPIPEKKSQQQPIAIAKSQSGGTPGEVISNALKNTDGLSPALGKQIKVQVDRAKYGGGSGTKSAFVGSPSHPEYGGNSRIFMARDALSTKGSNYDQLDTLNHLQQMKGVSNSKEGKPKTESEFYAKQANFDLATVWSKTSPARKEELAKEHGPDAMSSPNKIVDAISQELSSIRKRQEGDEERKNVEAKAARIKASGKKTKTSNKPGKDPFDDLF